MRKTLVMMLVAVTILASLVVGCTPATNEIPKDEVKVVDLKEVHKAVKADLGEDYVPEVKMEKETLESVVGLKVEDLEEYIAESPMISVNVDTFIAIKAKENKAVNIEKTLQSYRENLIDDSVQYPMNLAKIKASKVIRHEDYVFFVMLGKYDDREDVTEEEQLEFAEKQVENVENTINKFFK